MKCLAICITLLLLIIVPGLNSIYLCMCQYVNWNTAAASQMGYLNKHTDKNTIAELSITEYMTQLRDLNTLKLIQKADLLDINVEPHANMFDVLQPHKKTGSLQCASPPVTCFNDSNNYYFRTFDGSCNNLENPSYGMIKTRYSRILSPKYGDGLSAPSRSSTGKALPNSRLLSLSLYGEDTFFDNNHTLMTMQFGQFVAHDISQLYQEGLPDDCCTNLRNKMCYPIFLHPIGPIAMTTGKTCLNFARALSDREVSCSPNGFPYAEKITSTTAFLDLSSVYGVSQEQNMNIRQYEGGLLKTSWFNNKPFLPIKSGECPANNEQCYSIPDNRNQFTPTITVLQTIFVREHNRLANILGRINPQYSDERLFQVVRKINIAQFQKITYYDWLPLILSPTYCVEKGLMYSVSSDEYVNDYKSNLNPAPYAEYAAAGLRYLHQSIPGWFSMVSSGRSSNQTMRLSDYFDRQDTMQLLMEGNNFDSLIRGLATQLEKRVDGNIDREIKHHFDRKSFDEFGTDLKSIDIQRGRDFGLPSYNDLRNYCGLRKAHTWPDLLNEIPNEKIEVLKKFYDSPNDVELSVGGSFEKPAANSTLGPTFQCIIGQQFLTSRRADRFFYENENKLFGFTRAQLAEIRKISLASILCANSNSLQCIQPNVFLFPNAPNNLIKCEAFPQLNLELWKDNFLY